MNAHERQAFDVLLRLAVEHYAERLEQRCQGADAAAARLAADPDGDGVWLTQFVDAVFQDHLLDNTAGACFVLGALERRPAPAATGPGTAIATTLGSMARAAFAALLREQTIEELSRRAAFQPAPAHEGDGR